MEEGIGHHHIRYGGNPFRVTRPKKPLGHVDPERNPLLFRQRHVTLRDLHHVFRDGEYFHVYLVRLARLPEIMQHVDDIAQLRALLENPFHAHPDVIIGFGVF